MSNFLQLLYYRLVVAYKTYPHFFWIGCGILVIGIIAIIVVVSLRRGKRRSSVISTEDMKGIGYRYYRQGNYKKALKIFLEIGEFSGAGDCLFQIGKFRDAAVLYEKARNYQKAAEAFLKSGDQERAAENFAREGKFISAAEIYEKKGYKQKAAQLYQKGGNIEKAAELFKTLGNYSAAAKCYVTLYRQEGKESERGKEYLKKAGEMFFRAGEKEKGVEMLRMAGALEIAGRLAEEVNALTLAASCYEEAGLFEHSARVYRKLNNEKGYLMSMARHFESNNEFEKAAVCYEKAEMFNDAAHFYAKIQNFVKAAEMYEKDGRYGEAGEYYLSAGMERKAAECFEKAEEYEKAINLYKKIGDMKKVAELLLKKGNFKGAVEVYVKMGLLGEAIEILRKIPVSNPERRAVLLLIVQALIERGEGDKAISMIEGELRNEVVSENNVEMFYIYARLLEKKGDDKKAIEVYKKIYSLNPAFKDVEKRIDEIQKKTRRIPVVEQKERYDIIEEIGRGGMGVVYKAKDKVLNRIVAYKVLPATMKDNEAALDNFYKEARAAAALTHPNIVTVYDFGLDENGQYFIAMEYVEGETIKEKIKKMKKLPPKFIVDVGKEVCKGLYYAHSRKIFHRDIKSANIMVTRTGYVKIMDFGLAKIMHDALSSHTVVGGTPHYMAPEQILGEDIDARTDIYSLGVTLYEMACGRVPFIQGDVGYHHIHTPPPPPSQFNPSIPSGLEEVILKCMEKEKSRRYSSAQELFEALKKVEVR